MYYTQTFLSKYSEEYAYVKIQKKIQPVYCMYSKYTVYCILQYICSIYEMEGGFEYYKYR